MLPADIDFFKKLLSWSIIGYLLYSISFTKIFVGKKYKIYDLWFLFAYCLLTLPKIIIYYAQPFSQESPFIIFKYIIYFLSTITTSHSVVLSLLSLVLIIIISTTLYFKKPIYKKSFIGNINFKNYLIKTLFSLGLLYFISLFFGITIFNFFMEWFALAIDSVILVIGMLFYIFQFIKHHTNTASSEVLWNISNTGNDFYKELVELFSQRKTFFVGVSFLLVVHLLVDIGVYMIPYGVGTENSLYFDSLSINEREHIPLFNIFDSSDSQFGKDIMMLDSGMSFDSTAFMIFSLLVIYLFYFVAYFFLLLFPFLIFYYNVKKKKLEIPPFLLQIFLLSILFVGIFFIFYSDGFNSPLNIGISYNEQIEGIDIYTSQIIRDNYDTIAIELVSALLVVIALYGFLNYGCYRHYHYFKKSAYLFSLIFFLIYIGLYFVSFMTTPTYNYDDIDSIYQNPNFIKGEIRELATNKGNLIAIPFTNLTQNSTNSSYEAYIYYSFISNTPVDFENNPNFHLRENKENDKYEYRGYYELGQNKLDFSTPNLIKRSKIVSIFNSLQQPPSIYTSLNLVFEKIREAFLSLFYLLGMFFYSRYFLRKNVFSN